MKLGIIAQPFKGATTLYAVLSEWLSDPHVVKLDIAVAWAKRSGLRFVQSEIEAFKARGGELHLTMGIDAGGATRQGLELAQSLATTCVVFHHQSSRTFHPKIYLATGEGVAQAIIGSQNLTRGGFFENFEVGVKIDFELDNRSDAKQFAQLKELIHRYRNSGNSAIELDPGSLRKLLSNPLYDIQDEDRIPKYVSKDKGDAKHKAPVMFGRGNLDLVTAPGTPKRSVSGKRPKSSPPSGTRGVSATAFSAATSAQRSPATVTARWSKKLSAADAQWPEGAKTNPTGHLTLVKAGHPIKHGSWFRANFFGKQPWAKAEGTKETTSATFLVTIGTKNYGTHSLEITHKPTFESGQGNRTTVLHWGPKVGTLLKANNMKGQFISLEHLSDGTYNLVIRPSPTGPFLEEG